MTSVSGTKRGAFSDIASNAKRSTQKCSLRAKITPISAAPQSATNQTSESQTSTSSRSMNRWARRSNRKVSVLFLPSFITCSCLIICGCRRSPSTEASGRLIIMQPPRPDCQPRGFAGLWICSQTICCGRALWRGFDTAMANESGGCAAPLQLLRFSSQNSPTNHQARTQAKRGFLLACYCQ